MGLGARNGSDLKRFSLRNGLLRKVRRPAADLKSSGNIAGGPKVRRPAADLRKMGLGTRNGSDLKRFSIRNVRSAAQRQTISPPATLPEGLRSAAGRRILTHDNTSPQSTHDSR